jgi:ribosomal protein S18 acetylase RimI-like enzyme
VKSVPKIVAFGSSDAQKLAELFNTFDRGDLWPGGFTGGVPFTAERVLSSFPAGVKNITVLISTFKGKFTGICSLHPHAEDAEAAYIGVFGVHPDFLGKGHGKAMILRALQIAADNNLRRVDLNTWAGNMRAVPLYKKSGMFWVPETSVYMQDFIPGILNFPLAREFFKKHDWYSSQVRKLENVPDEFKLDEMEVFPYEFAAGKDSLKVWVDRHGRSIMGVERTLDGGHLRILCRLKDHKVIAGLEHELFIEIANDTESSMQGSVFLSGFEGLDVSSHPQESFKIERGASRVLGAKFMVSPQTEAPEASRKQKLVRASLIINGELLPFEIGMRILPLLEFKTFPETLTVTPGTVGKVQVNAFNNSKELFKGSVFVVDEDSRLSLDENVVLLDVPAKSHSGFSFNMKVGNDQPTSVIPLELRARGKVKGALVETKTEQLYVKCLRPGGIVASVEKREPGRQVIVENENIVAQVQLREALLNVTFKDTLSGRQDVWLRGGFGIGPPFGFVKPIEYDYEIVRQPEGLELVLSGLHPDKPGIKMMRVLTFFAGSGLIKDQVKVVNSNPEASYDVNVRVGGQSSVRNLFKMVVPLKEVVEHEMIGFPVSESDLPTDPKEYKESWICYQNEAQDFCFGQVWSEERLSKIRFGEGSLMTPEYKLGQVKPGQIACTSELYYVIERGSWQNIRRKWQSLIEKKIRPEEERVDSTLLFNVQLAETLLYDRAELKTQLNVVNFRNKEASGEVVLTPPKGWKVVPSKVDIKKVAMNNPFAANVSLLPPSKAELGVHSGSIDFCSDKQVVRFPLDVCLLSRNAERVVSVSQVGEEGKAGLKVFNGLLRFKASAEFAGCLYFLSRSDEVNQLCSNFPRIGTKVFLENYTGGIRALYLGDAFDFAKSKSHEESYEAEQVEEGRWKGVKFSFESKQQEQIRGVLGSVAYLTLPLSNIVKIKRRFENPTSASFRFYHSLWISPNVGGNFDKNDVIFPRGGKVLQFKRAGEPAVSGVQPEKGWALVANAEQKMGLGIIAGNPDKSMVLSLDVGKTMLEMLVMSRVQLQPKQSCELEDYVVLSNEDHETIDKLSEMLRKAAEKPYPKHD